MYHTVNCIVRTRATILVPHPLRVHAMMAELRSQSARQPALTESRVQDLFRKLLGPRQVSTAKNNI